MVRDRCDLTTHRVHPATAGLASRQTRKDERIRTRHEIVAHGARDQRSVVRNEDGPGHPDVPMSPNDAYREALGRTGYIQQPPSQDLYFSLLPVVWTKIRRDGCNIKRLRYDGACLDPYRNVASTYRKQNGKWPFRYDPRNRNQVYWQNPTDGRWHALRWVFADQQLRGFTEHSLDEAKRMLVARGENAADQQAVAEALVALQGRTDSTKKRANADKRRRLRNVERERIADRDRIRSEQHLAPEDPPSPSPADDRTAVSNLFDIDYDTVEPLPVVD